MTCQGKTRNRDGGCTAALALYRSQQVVERAASSVYVLLSTHGTRSRPSMEQAAMLDQAGAVLQGAAHETTQLLQVRRGASCGGC